MGVASGERFCKRNEESFTFVIHWRVKFENKSGFIYLQDSNTYALQYMCAYMKNTPKYNWEAWSKMKKSVEK